MVLLSRRRIRRCFSEVLFLAVCASATFAFQQQCNSVPFVRRRTTNSMLLAGGSDSMEPPQDDEDDNGGGIGDFLNPQEESENLRRARNYMSEESLPLSFSEEDEKDDDDDDQDDDEPTTVNGSSLTLANGQRSSSPPGALFADGPSAETLRDNPYMQVVSKLSPSELISKFTTTANPRVQDAVRNTVLGLIGSLPKMAFDTTTITTGARLASLMFQLQMTGYLLKNADYRLSLSQSLGMKTEHGHLLLAASDDDDDDDDDDEYPVDGKVKGKLRLKYGGSSNEQQQNASATTMEVEVDAAAYMSELRSEVKQLRDELMRTKQSKEDAIRKDLLLYIRTLPEQEMRSLTSTMSEDVLVAMKGLVNAVMAGIGGDGSQMITAETVTEQSGEAMAQLCMWQLVVGYNLRELEVREEMKKNLLMGYTSSSSSSDDVDTDGGFE